MNRLGSQSSFWRTLAPTDKTFHQPANLTTPGDGEEYVAYLFADTPGLIKCGSYSGTGNYQEIDCGFSAGWLLAKSSNKAGSWYLHDIKRNGDLKADDSNPEAVRDGFSQTASGFGLAATALANLVSTEYVYVAIAEGAAAGQFFPTGVLTEDADASGPSMTLTDITVNGCQV